MPKNGCELTGRHTVHIKRAVYRTNHRTPAKNNGIFASGIAKRIYGIKMITIIIAQVEMKYGVDATELLCTYTKTRGL